MAFLSAESRVAGVIRGELMSSMERRLKVCWERQGRAADVGVVEFQTQSTSAQAGHASW